jgi:hypothetical protein
VLGAIFGQNTIGTFGFTTGMTAGQTHYISYVVGNNSGGFPNLSDPCLSVSPGQPVVFFANPVANAGQDVYACGLTAQVTGTAVNGTVLWTNVPPGALSITTPSNAVTQVVGTSLGMFQLAYTVTVNGCSDTDTVSVHFTGNPATTTPVYTCDPTNQFYTVTFTISGGGLAYTVNGSAVVGDTFVSGAIPNGGSHNFVVFDDNGCPAPLVSGSFACDCATNAGQINTTPVTVCQSDSVYVQLLGGQNTDADDVLVYVLHTGPPDTIGTVIAVNNTGAFGFWATMNFGTTYYLSVAAGNNQNGFPDPSDPCFDVTTGKPVVFQQDPVPNAGDNFVVCGLTANMPAIASGFAGQWTQTGGSPAIAIASTSDPKTMITASAAGTYQFHWTETNGQCGAFDSLEVTFLQNPAIDTIIPVCDGTNTAYTISFDVLAGNGGYQITGLAGSFNGTTFTSVPLTNGVPYTFQIQDLFGCQSVVYAGSHLCPCTSDAGTMDQTPAVFCADMPAVATWNNDATLDANDGVQFILHDAAGTSPGTILATNSQPIFNFGPGLQTGTTYYISAMVGNLTGGTIDANDLCKSVAAGTPVQWKMLPDAVLTGDATICNGSSTVLNINGSGAFPLLVTYQDGNGTTSTAALNNAQTFTLAVTPLLTTTYTLVSVSDGTTPTCSATLNSSVTVQVNQPVNAGIAAPPQELCAGTNQPIDLRSLLTGENPGGVWIETSAAPSTGTAFNSSAGTFNASNQLPGVYTFRYQVQALAPCPNQSATVTVTIHPTPVADAGLDQVIDCHQDSVLLGGTGTTTGTGIQYNWSLGGSTIGTDAVYQTGAGGIYNLLITNEFGCTATDATTVTVNDDFPVAKQINVQQISCNGANDGAIVLDSIVSAFQPVLISINGGPFESDRTFKNLEPGFYTIILMDDNECIWSPGSIAINEPPLTTVDLGAEVIVMLGDSVHLQAMVSLPEAALDTFFWRPLFDPTHATTFMQSFLPFKSSYVTLSVVDSNGCEASSTVLVRVERPEQVYIPNVIYPESGNENARITVYGGIGVTRIEYFRIFDRWGDQVFSADNFTPNDPGNGWDATHRGDLVSPGVYVYVAKVHFVDGAVEIYKGDVTVVR